MATVVITILLLIAIVLAVMSLYLLLLTVAAALHPERKLIDGVFRGEHNPETRFILLIPAHDEEILIGTVIADLRKQTYPDTEYETVVIADNCEDRTAEIATEAGATVLTRNEPDIRGKGQALHWAMTGPLQHWPRPYDAVVVMDADSVMNPDFFWFFNERFQQGARLLQAYYGVQNPLENWRTSLMTAALACVHFLRPLGRALLHLPCGLKGNGMGFDRELVAEYGYPAFSVVEDAELRLFLLEKGIHAQFVPGAQVRGQMTTSGAAARTQRSRWEGGRTDLLRQWSGRLVKAAVSRKDPACIEALGDLLIPPLAMLALTTAAVTLVACAAWILNPSRQSAFLLIAGCTGIVAQGLYVGGALLLTRAPVTVYARLCFAPVFVFWKCVVYGKMIFLNKSRGDWVRTGRHKMDGSNSGTSAKPFQD